CNSDANYLNVGAFSGVKTCPTDPGNDRFAPITDYTNGTTNGTGPGQGNVDKNFPVPNNPSWYYGVCTWYMPFNAIPAGSGALGQKNDAPFLWFQNGSDLTVSGYQRNLSNVRKASQVALLVEGDSTDMTTTYTTSNNGNVESWIPRIAGRHGQKQRN